MDTTPLINLKTLILHSNPKIPKFYVMPLFIAVDHLAREGYDPVYGARPVKRALQRELLQPLAVALLRGDFVEDDVVQARGLNSGGQFLFYIQFLYIVFGVLTEPL